MRTFFISTCCALAIAAMIAQPAFAMYATKSNTTVTQVQVFQQSGLTAFYVKLASGHSGVTGCGSVDWAIIPTGPNYPGSQQLLQLALTAFLSGRTVDAVIYNSGGNSPVCFDGGMGGSTYPELRTLVIK